LKSLRNDLHGGDDKLSRAISAAGFCTEQEIDDAQLDPTEITELKESVRRFDQCLSDAQSDLRTAQKQAEGLSRQDEVPLRQAVDASDAKRNTMQEELARLGERQRSILEMLGHITKHDAQRNLLEQQYGIMGDIAEVANGRGRNTQRVNFQKFILAHILDQVLEVATERLQQMTRGRFSLIRAEQRESSARAFGLDLNLYDQNTATQREVRTLSGGEGFQASLALALGLSDVVQQQSGGVQLDTLLIDEGFGSLSPDALDNCVRVLERLSGNGKLVGIISHVPELKERLDAQLVVTATPSGSQAHFSI